MLDHSILDISMLQIRLFLLMAEERNFSRVAAMANMTQPTLSRRIAQLEQTLNLKLFNREDRPVTLTPEGETLYKGWKRLQEDFNIALNEAKKVRSDDYEYINLSTIESGNNKLSLSLLTAWMNEKVPNIHTHIQYSNFSAWRSKLLSGEIDILQTVLFETIDLDDAFTWEQITVCPKEVVMLKTNPLADNEELTIGDLKDQRFIVISPMESPHYFKYVQKLCREHGFELQVGLHVTDPNNLINSIRNNNEVLICDKYLRDHDNPLMKHIPITDTWSGLVAIWKKNNPKKNIPDVIKAIKEYMNSKF